MVRLDPERQTAAEPSILPRYSPRVFGEDESDILADGFKSGGRGAG